MRLILASASPRRRELLAQAGYAFEVRPADVNEDPRAGEDPIAYVTRLAREKAMAAYAAGVRDQVSGVRDLVVLGADTTVVVDGEMLAKPVDADDARRMLRMLSGRTHRVITGVAVVSEAVTRGRTADPSPSAQDDMRLETAAGPHSTPIASAISAQGRLSTALSADAANSAQDDNSITEVAAEFPSLVPEGEGPGTPGEGPRGGTAGPSTSLGAHAPNSAQDDRARGEGAVRVEVAAEVTAVTFLTLSDAEIDAYIATGEPMDKAGAYAIQGRAAKWIPRIEGCYFNVVGLPLALVGTMIEGVGSRE